MALVLKLKMSLWGHPTPIMLKKQNKILSDLKKGRKYAIAERDTPDMKTPEDRLLVVEHPTPPKGWRILSNEEAEEIRFFIVSQMDACTIFSTSDVEKTAPFSGTHDVYECGVFDSCRRHPTNVGLTIETISQGYPSLTRVVGRVAVATLDNGMLYRVGSYDFITNQTKPENWSGWFDD